MIVRKIRPEEMKNAIEIWAHVFQIPLKDAALSSAEFFKSRTADPKSRQDQYWMTRWATFDDKEEVMMSSLIAMPYTMQFDGHDVPMAGVGDVAVLPPYRKCGCTRACLTAALQDACENGALFSYLYPFSAVFYRKFGFGRAGERNRWTVRLDAVPACPVSGSFRLMDGIDGDPDCEADLRTVDKAWYRSWNLMTLDEDVEYREMQSLRPFENTTYTYIYYDAERKPAAAVTYTRKEKGLRTLLCSHFAFADSEGCLALLALLGKEKAQHDYAEIVLPGNFDLSAILPEWTRGAVTCTREQYGMVRVLNAQKVLRMAKAKGSGTLRIRITDPVIEENNACFSVSFENGTVTEVSRTAETEDIALTISAFSTLISGRCDPEMLPYLPEVQLHCDTNEAGKLFYRKPVFTERMF